MHNERESNVNGKTEQDRESSLNERLLAAADALEAGTRRPDVDGLLRYLGYGDGPGEPTARARMLRAAAKFRRIFQIPVPDAPGLIFFGGEADPGVLDGLAPGLPVGSLAGSGLSPERAFESCVGEGVEYLSQFLRSSDRVELDTRRRSQDEQVDVFIRALLAACQVPATQRIAWVAAHRLTDNRQEWFPADLCYRRAAAQQDFAPPLKLSTGCAAGASFDAAAQRAILELVERDAVALWWRGGRRGRPIAREGLAGAAAAELWGQLRGGNDQRRSWLLEITTDLGIPAVAALSANHDGYGFAFGFGARMTLADAARAAIFELSQVELGQHVIAAKRRESGDAALNDSDRRQLRRGTLFDTKSCPLLHPEGEPSAEEPYASSEPADALRFLMDRLAASGISAYLLDLTRSDFDIPVVRVLAPGLQLEPCQIIGDRLALAIAETGGGAVHTGGLPLL